MTLVLVATLLGLGFLGAFFAGLLGIGGALVMIPLLLYVPPLLGVGQLDVKAVAGVTMTEVFVASLFGFLAHRRYHAVNPQLASVGGLASAAGSFAGALLSKSVDDRWLLLVFAALATIGAALSLVPDGVADPSAGGETMRFSTAQVAVVAGSVGLAAGFVGAGGAFLLVPLLVAVVGVPVRITIGSSLGITAVSAAAGFLGKLISHQIAFVPALAVAVGAVPGAQLGAAVSRRVSSQHLKQALSVTVLVAAVRVWWDVFGPVALVAIPVGFALGLVIGATGMGSGLLIAPLSYAIFGLDFAHAVSLALVYTVCARLSGALSYRRWATVRWRPALLYGLLGVPGAVLGSQLVYTGSASVRWALPFFLGGILLVVAVLIALDAVVWLPAGREDRGFLARATPFVVVRGAVAQLLVGTLVGLTAVGSGSLVIISQLRLFRMPAEEVVGSALVSALMMVVPAGVTHFVLGSIDWRFVGLLTAGSMVGTVLSPAAGRIAPRRAVNLTMAGLVVLGAIMTVLRAMAAGRS